MRGSRSEPSPCTQGRRQGEGTAGRDFVRFAGRSVRPLTPTLSPEYRGEGEYARNFAGESMKRQISLSVLALLLILQLGADTPAPALRYLTPQSLDVVALLPDPVQSGADEQKRELGLLFDVQQSRT